MENGANALFSVIFSIHDISKASKGGIMVNVYVDLVVFTRTAGTS